MVSCHPAGSSPYIYYSVSAVTNISKKLNVQECNKCDGGGTMTKLASTR